MLNVFSSSLDEMSRHIFVKLVKMCAQFSICGEKHVGVNKA